MPIPLNAEPELAGAADALRPAWPARDRGADRTLRRSTGEWGLLKPGVSELRGGGLLAGVAAWVPVPAGSTVDGELGAYAGLPLVFAGDSPRVRLARGDGAEPGRGRDADPDERRTRQD